MKVKTAWNVTKEVLKWAIVGSVLLWISTLFAPSSETEEMGIGTILAMAAVTILVVWVIYKLVRHALKPTQSPSPQPNLGGGAANFAKSPAGKNILTAIILTAIYGFLIWAIYNPMALWAQSKFGLTEMQSWFVMTSFGLLVFIPAVWILYQAANIPGDPEKVKSTMRRVAFVVLILMAYVSWKGPTEMFTEDGRSKFWVDIETGEHFYDPEASKTDSATTKFSSKTGNPLRLGTREDIRETNTTGGISIKETIGKIDRFLEGPPPRIDTVHLWPGLPTIDPPNRTTVFIVPKAGPEGPRWSQMIRLQGSPRGQARGYFDARVETWCNAIGLDGYSKEESVIVGPTRNKAYGSYFQDATAITYLQRKDMAIEIHWHPRS